MASLRYLMVAMGKAQPMEFADKSAIAELIQAWGAYRDQGKWKELRSTFTRRTYFGVVVSRSVRTICRALPGRLCRKPQLVAPSFVCLDD